jgi:hypothetical protein
MLRLPDFLLVLSILQRVCVAISRMTIECGGVNSQLRHWWFVMLWHRGRDT